jgi:hypothetical protein
MAPRDSGVIPARTTNINIAFREKLSECWGESSIRNRETGQLAR